MRASDDFVRTLDGKTDVSRAQTTEGGFSPDTRTTPQVWTSEQKLCRTG